MNIKVVVAFVIEFVMIAIGTGVFVTSALTSSINEEGAGFGAFMIVTGLLFKSWKKDFMGINNQESINRKEKVAKTNVSLVAGLILVVAFTFWGMQQGKIQRLSSEVSSLEYVINSLESDIRYNRSY